MKHEISAPDQNLPSILQTATQWSIQFVGINCQYRSSLPSPLIYTPSPPQKHANPATEFHHKTSSGWSFQWRRGIESQPSAYKLYHGKCIKLSYSHVGNVDRSKYMPSGSVGDGYLESWGEHVAGVEMSDDLLEGKERLLSICYCCRYVILYVHWWNLSCRLQEVGSRLSENPLITTIPVEILEEMLTWVARSCDGWWFQALHLKACRPLESPLECYL